ncbi:hypothetical protein [Bowmanella denitrificans]|uniref:hypothetical protein n=1 Tax=Bowmanella denitrificans TaxID=366582 RepID=UPI000C9AB841|nr:hypothetical protein [Bowmanella denitrificans]
MEQSLLYLCLLLLALGLALNLKLTFYLYYRIHNPPPPVALTQVPPGERLVLPKARQWLSGCKVELEADQQARVLLFLSSRCDKCREKLPQLSTLPPLAEQAGVRLWLLSTEPDKRLRRFLTDSPLIDHLLKLDKKAYQSLNPSWSSPFYLFIDHAGYLQAAGTIGDEDWQSFMQQMDEVSSEMEVAS